MTTFPEQAATAGLLCLALPCPGARRSLAGAGRHSYTCRAMLAALGSRRVWAFAAALLVAGAALYGLGSIRHPPEGPRAGIVVSPPAVHPRAPSGLHDAIRVGTFNIRRARGRDGIGESWRTTVCMAGLDLLALQEVDGGTPLDTGVDQARMFGRWLGLHSLYAAAERQFWHDHFGNALLSAAPVQQWVNIALPRHDGPSYRSLLMARMELLGRPVTVMVTHVDRRGDRPDQLAAVLDQFRRAEAPVLLLGDLNTSALAPEIAAIVTDPDIVAVNNGVDWVIARGFTAGATTLCDVGGSDHARLAVDLTFADAP
ncbi:MAG: hypothetical protein KDA64_06325 [Rhodospirillaceae bacterium]|nr:hypothetical protein [Rhodospirillaceae bacterium]